MSAQIELHVENEAAMRNQLVNDVGGRKTTEQMAEQQLKLWADNVAQVVKGLETGTANFAKKAKVGQEQKYSKETLEYMSKVGFAVKQSNLEIKASETYLETAKRIASIAAGKVEVYTSTPPLSGILASAGDNFLDKFWAFKDTIASESSKMKAKLVNSGVVAQQIQGDTPSAVVQAWTWAETTGRLAVNAVGLQYLLGGFAHQIGAISTRFMAAKPPNMATNYKTYMKNFATQYALEYVGHNFLGLDPVEWRMVRMGLNKFEKVSLGSYEIPLTFQFDNMAGIAWYGLCQYSSIQTEMAWSIGHVALTIPEVFVDQGPTRVLKKLKLGWVAEHAETEYDKLLLRGAEAGTAILETAARYAAPPNTTTVGIAATTGAGYAITGTRWGYNIMHYGKAVIVSVPGLADAELFGLSLGKLGPEMSTEAGRAALGSVILGDYLERAGQMSTYVSGIAYGLVRNLAHWMPIPAMLLSSAILLKMVLVCLTTIKPVYRAWNGTARRFQRVTERIPFLGAVAGAFDEGFSWARAHYQRLKGVGLTNVGFFVFQIYVLEWIFKGEPILIELRKTWRGDYDEAVGALPPGTFKRIGMVWDVIVKEQKLVPRTLPGETDSALLQLTDTKSQSSSTTSTPVVKLETPLPSFTTPSSSNRARFKRFRTIRKEFKPSKRGRFRRF
jgi:hypothetical protein